MRRGLLPVVAVIAVLIEALPASGRAEKLSAADLQRYRNAFAAVEQEKWSDARSFAAQAKNALPAKVVQWLDLIRPGPGRSFTEYTAFIAANPDWPGQSTLRAQAERAMPDNLSPSMVLQWFGEKAPSTLPGTMRLAGALIARSQEPQAIALIRRGWINFDVVEDDETAFLARYRRYLRPQDHVDRLDRLLWDGQQTAARRLMPRVDTRYQAVAEARLRLMNDDPGVDWAVGKVPPDLLRDVGLTYERARWRRRKDMLDEMLQLLDPPQDAGRHAEILWPEKERAARHALSRGDISVAYRIAASHGVTDGVSYAEGEWLAGWIALRFLEDRQTAYRHFTQLYAGVGTTISLSRAAYWSGRAAEDMGELALAQNWYQKAAENPTTYYGQLAAHRIGRTDALRFAPLPVPSDAEVARFNKLEMVRIVRLLTQLGEADRTRAFLIRLADLADKPTEHRLVADLAGEGGRDDLAIAAAKSVRLKGTELIEYLYPLRRLADGGGPEKALLLAVMRQESAFDRKAVSPAGARGLMQLMPSTAKAVSKRLKLKFDVERLDDPNFNIQLGRAYMVELADSFSGSYVLAIAAYNAGPTRVVEWMRLYGDPRDYGVDVVDWIESIPFPETRNYVQRVMENLQVYRHRLGDTQVALSLDRDLGLRSTP